MRDINPHRWVFSLGELFFGQPEEAPPYKRKKTRGKAIAGLAGGEEERKGASRPMSAQKENT